LIAYPKAEHPLLVAALAERATDNALSCRDATEIMMLAAGHHRYDAEYPNLFDATLCALVEVDFSPGAPWYETAHSRLLEQNPVSPEAADAIIDAAAQEADEQLPAHPRSRRQRRRLANANAALANRRSRRAAEHANAAADADSGHDAGDPTPHGLQAAINILVVLPADQRPDTAALGVVSQAITHLLRASLAELVAPFDAMSDDQFRDAVLTLDAANQKLAEVKATAVERRQRTVAGTAQLELVANGED
jgi:hypothetical protein